MTAMFYTLLLGSIFFISCRADEAVIQAPFDESGSQAPFDDAATKILQNSIVSHLEEVAEKMDTHRKNAPIQREVYKDCKALYDAGYTTSGVYTIKPDSVNKAVYCEQEMDGGGWTVFQRRINGSVDFHRGWDEYKHGFGSPAGEYWIGNDLLYSLTSNKNTQLLVELQYRNETEYAKYTDFSVQDESNNYTLQVAGYSGGSTPEDSLVPHNGLPFSTYDRDNDVWEGNCALNMKGAWWYANCFQSSLNTAYNIFYHKTGLAGWMSWKRCGSTLSGDRLMVKAK